MRLSVDLRLLWTDHPLHDVIHAAKAAGLGAVLASLALRHAPPGQSCCRYCGNRLPLLSLNTSRGNVASGKNSVAVLPGREADARTALDEAITVAADTKAAHVMAGFATGPDAEVCFRANR